MKKLFNFLLVLLIGAILGYVFHNPIDTKLKEKFGSKKVEAGKEIVEDLGEKTAEVGKAAFDAGKEKLDSMKNEE
ncbi:MAG: hypothetical protein R3182_14865 [Draconibacterium sp.]|nr:hypothetical protein [Draconibacterium sp.]